MAKQKSQPETTEPKRGRGRPRTFPDVATEDMVSILTRVPPEVQTQFRAIAERANRGKGEALNATFARLIGKAFEASERGRDRSSSKTS